MPTKNAKVLIVDDTVQILSLLSTLLNHSGYIVRSAQDGFSALAAIRNQVPEMDTIPRAIPS